MIRIQGNTKTAMSGFRARSGRRGFTLVELLIGTLITSIVLVVAFQVLVGERRSTEARRQEVNAQQNLRIALDRLTRDIRMAGLGIDEFNRQPRIVDAGPWQIGFNADISSGVGGDPAMDKTLQIKLSGGGVYSPGNYPDENIGSLTRYNGGSETVVLGLDSNFDGVIDNSDYYDATEIPVDYAIFRSVNSTRSARLAYGIRGPDAYPDGHIPEPLFSYWGTFAGGNLSLWGDTDGDGSLSQTEISNLTPVSATVLSKIIYVDVKVVSFTEGQVASMGHTHGTPADPFNYMEMAHDTRIRPRNIGVNPAGLSACGDPPARPNGVWAIDTPADAGQSISIYFTASSDEAGGEEDVTHYFVYRKPSGGSWGAPIAQVPATGQGSYSWANDIHTADEADIPVDGEAYYYCVSTWDCKPQESSLSHAAGPVSSQPNGSEPPVLVNVYDTPCDAGEEITLIFNASPDEGASMVDSYRVFRGPLAGDFLAKTLIGYINADGSPTYTYQDNVANNVAGAPPQNDVDYWYTVRAVTDTIVSVDSNELGPVCASAGLSAAQLEYVLDVPFDSGTALQINWLRSESETCVPNPVIGYQLERKGPVDEVFGIVDFYAITGDPAYTVQDSNLIAGQPYVYRVMTKSSTDEQPSNEITGVPTNNNDLLPPTNVQAQSVPCDATGAIRLTWNRSFHDNGSGDAEYYRIWRRIQGGGAFGELTMLAVSAQSEYSWDDDEFSPSPPVIGNTYDYVITTYNQTMGNESGYSTTATCTASSVPGAPYLYYAIDTPNDHGGSISMKWRRSNDDGTCTDTVTEYRVYRGEEWGVYSEDPIGVVFATDSNFYYYVDNGSGGADPPQDGVYYYYMVRAWDDEIESANSNQRGPVTPLDDATSTQTIFHDGFEADIGWTHGGSRDDWQRGDPTAQGQTYGESDPENAYLGDDVYGTDIGASGWNGTYRGFANSWLMSPAIDCSNAEDVVFSLQRWLNVEQPQYDQAIIEVSGNGEDGPWQQIWINSVEITDTSWIYMEFDIGAWADGVSDLRIRFRLVADSNWHYSGWNIDEVDVIGQQ